MHQRLHESVEETFERVQTIMHRGTDSDRKEFLRALGTEIGRLPDDLFGEFSEAMLDASILRDANQIQEHLLDSLDEGEVPVGTEFEEKD